MRYSLAVFTLLAVCFASGWASSILLTVATPTINQYSLYEFQIFDSGAWSQAGTVQITFQSPPYSFSNNTNISSCMETVTSAYILNCYASTTSQISFKWTTALVAAIGSTVGDSLLFQVTLQNPTYVDTFSISYAYYLENGTPYSSASNTVKGLTADSLTACAITFNPSYTSTLAAVTVQLTTKNSIPAGGSLQLSVSGYTTGNTLTSVSTNSNAMLNGSAFLSYSGQYYVFSSFFASSISSGSSLTFTANSILSPPTTALNTYSYTLSTLYTTSYQNPIDTKSCSLSVSDYPIAVTITFSGTFYVGNTVKPNITYTPSVETSLATDTFGFTVDSTSTNYISISTTNSQGSGGNFLNSSTLINTKIYYIANTTNGVSYPVSSNTDTFPANSILTQNGGINVKSLVNSGTKTVFLQVFRSSNSYASGKATFTVKPNSLVAVTITPLSYIVSAVTTYTFAVTVRNPLALGGGVRITLPSDLYIPTGTCSATASSSYGGAIGSSNTCTVTTSSSITYIFISNVFSAAFPTNTSFSVAVSNILNPISAKQTGSFTFQTYYSSSELTNPVDDSTQLTGLTVTPSAATITPGNFAVTRTSTTNMQYTVYSIKYVVTSKFKANGYLTISFPTYMVLSSSNVCNFTVKYTTNVTTASQTIIPTATTGSTYLLTFNFSSLITADLAAGCIISITITSLRNHYSFKPVNSQLITYSNDGYAVEQSGATDVQLTNTVQDTALTVSSTTTIRMNGNPTTATFQITPPSTMNTNDVISTELENTGNSNTQMSFSSSLSCIVGGSTSSCAVDSSNSRLIYLTLASGISASTNYGISISSIILNRCFDQPGKIYFRTFQKSGGVLYNISSMVLTPQVNTLTNSVKTVALSINELSGNYPSKLNQLQQFTLTISTTNYFQTGDIVVVTIPSQYSFVGSTVTVTNTSDLTTMTGSLCSDSTLFCSNNNTSGNLLRVAEKVAGNVFKNVSSISFTVTNGSYRSPQLWTNYNSQSFTVNTYSSTGQPVDAVQSGTTTNATFYLACTNAANHCGTCYANASCASCYALGTGYDTTFNYGGYYYSTSIGTCVISCGTNFYNASNMCIQCTSPCYSCSGSGSFCSSCVNTTIGGQGPFYLYNNTCPSICPDKYFQDSGNICSACSTLCLACSGSSIYCTSCNNGTYLSSRLNACVSSSQCETYQYADSSTWKCTNCSVSCNGCSINDTYCTACSSGYIIDVSFKTTLPGKCTNICPTGTVNDTANAFGGGCRCNTTCLTCQTTLSYCLTCNSPKYLQNNLCVSSCSSGYFINGSSCMACVANCSTCSSSSCSACSNGYYLYENICYSSCPIYTTTTTVSGVLICFSCGSGCTNCLDSSHCLNCTSGMIPQQSTSSRSCVFSCSTGYVKINNAYCGTSCPGDSTEVNGVCITNTTSISNSNSTVVSSLTTSTSRFIPFPYTIALVVLVIFTLTSRLAFSHTIIPAGLCAFGGIVEVLSWLTLIIVEGVDPTDSKGGLYVVLIAFLLTLALNIIQFILFRKYIWKDEKFQMQYKKLGKTKTGPCVTYSCIITSIVFSHKFIEILFSNLFESNFFIYKVAAKRDLVPLNYIRYVSLLPSVLAICGGGIANYNLQTSTLNSIVFIQSIDVILVTIFSAIFGFVVTVRKEEDYENNLAQKRNDIEQEFDHDILGENVYHLQEEENEGNKQSKYRHKSSIMIDDPKENPLGKRNTNRVGPIGTTVQEMNLTNAPLGEKEDGFNREDLLNGFPSNRHNRNKNKNKNQDQIGIDQIMLQQDGGDNVMAPKRSNLKKGDKSNRYKQKVNEDPQKSKIKNNIENKLTQDQIQKTKIVKDVDTIDTSQLEKQKKDKEGSDSIIKDLTKNEMKKEKLEVLASDPENLSLIPQSDRAKAGEMKNAMKILNAKKVQIGEYLEYLDIIDQEVDQDLNSEDYDQKLPNKKNKNGPGKPVRKNKNLVTSKKTQKRDRTGRKDDNLVILDGHKMYDDDLQPEIADFHQTPIKGRKLSGDNYLSNEDQFQNNFSSLKKNAQNRSDQNFGKKNGLNDLVLVSLQSGDNYDKSLAEQFQKGNTLRQTQKDDLPPNIYSTQNMNKGSLKSSIPLARDRIIPNTLINDETQIQYLQSDGGDQQTIKGELLDFNNDVSPSHFDQANMRIANQGLSEAPTKPRLIKMKGEAQIGQVQNYDDEEDYDEFNHAYDNNELPETKLERYQSNQGALDYDDIIHQRRNNQRVKELEKIYLPRQHVNRRGDPNRARKNVSSQSYRKQDR